MVDSVTTSNETTSKVVIETPRLILRGARISDVDDMFDCFKVAEVMRYWYDDHNDHRRGRCEGMIGDDTDRARSRDTLPHASSEETRKWVEKMIEGPNNGVLDFVISLKSHMDGAEEVIGKVGVWRDNEIGFLLNCAYWGKGYALQAVMEVLDLAFDVSERGVTGRPRLEDVAADVDPRNQPSLGILKKLGFEVYATKEKTFEVGGEWVDSVYLCLRREVWVQRRTELKSSKTPS